MNPISNLEKQFKIPGADARWAEQVVRRRVAVCPSESDWTGERVPPPPESLLPSPPAGQCLSKQCSSCSCVKKQSENTLGKDAEKKVREFGLQQVEARLYNAEMEEAMRAEQLERSQESLHRAAQIVEAQVLFAQSLDLKARAVARLTQLTGNFAYKDLTPTQSLAEALDNVRWDAGLLEDLREVQAVSLSATEAPEQLYQLIEEYRDKRRDYQTASDTFSQYLRSSARMRPSHLRKFESQHDTIRSNYTQSRQILESELPKLIQEKQQVLSDCFAKLVPIQEKLLDQDKQFLTLSMEIAKCFKEPSKKQSCRHLCQEKCSNHNHKSRHN